MLDLSYRLGYPIAIRMARPAFAVSAGRLIVKPFQLRGVGLSQSDLKVHDRHGDNFDCTD